MLANLIEQLVLVSVSFMQTKGKRVVIVGQSGIDKQTYLEEVVGQQYVEKKERKKMKLFNVGNEMYDEAKQARGKIEPGKILKLPLVRLNMLRRSVCKDIIHHCEMHPKENILINTHSCFRWERGLFHAFDFDLLVRLNPGVYCVDVIY